MGMSISNQNFQLQMRTVNAKLEFRSQDASLSIQQKQAVVDIQTEMPKVLIDQYPCWATSGLKNVEDLGKQNVSNAKQSCSDFISRKVSEGKAFASIENHTDAISRMAKNNQFTEHEFGMVSMPGAQPNFRVTGSIKMEMEGRLQLPINGVSIAYNPGRLDVTYTPGKVDIYI